MTTNNQNPLTEHQFRTLLGKVFDDYLSSDYVDPEDVDYEEVMAALREEPLRYEAVSGIRKMRKGDEAIMMFSAFADCGALGYTVECVDYDWEHERPIVQVRDYEAVKNDQSALGGKRPVEFVPEGPFKVGRKSKTRSIERIRRPIWA